MDVASDQGRSEKGCTSIGRFFDFTKTGTSARETDTVNTEKMSPLFCNGPMRIPCVRITRGCEGGVAHKDAPTSRSHSNRGFNLKESKPEKG